MERRFPLWPVVNTLLAALSAALLTLSLPPFGTPWLVWIALIPAYCICRQDGVKRSLPFLCLAGVAFFVCATGWVGRFHALAVPFVAVLYGLLTFAVPMWLSGFVLRRQPALGVVAAPAFWVAFEYLRSSWPLRFPFGVLGTTQFHWPRLIQFVDVTGVWGVSFLIVLVNATLFRLGAWLLARAPRSALRASLVPAIVTVALLSAALGYGTARIRADGRDRAGTLTIALVQTRSTAGSSADALESILDEGGAFFRIARTYRPDLIVLPENWLKGEVTIDPVLRDERSVRALGAVSRHAAGVDASVLFGALGSRTYGEEIRHYNMAYLFSRSGDLTGAYRKRVLVPFGEYYPFGRLFPRLRQDLLETSGARYLDPGTDAPVMDVAAADGRVHGFGVLICFESALGYLARDYARRGARFLVNITDDYWSRSPAAMSQHAVLSVFRAVENRVPVVRAANGGVTCFVSSTGHLYASIPPLAPGVLASTVRLHDEPVGTIYTRWGDWLPWLCAVFAAVAMTWSLCPANARQRPPEQLLQSQADILASGR